MPSTLVEVRTQYTPAEESALLDAVHRALVDAFKIPESDRTGRLVVHEPHRFECSPNVPQPERFTLIGIDCFSGRSVDAKRALYANIVRNLEPLGIPASCVKVVVRDLPRENWGLRGLAACDFDVGFRIEV